MNLRSPKVTASSRVDVATILDGLEMHLQPIVDVATGSVLAAEALARFHHAPGLRADEVIAEAHAAGYGYTLEAACLRAALDRRDELPAGVKLAVNVSPDVVHHPIVARRWPPDLDDVIVEVTEHRAHRPAALQDELAQLRLRGAAIAVDDVGTGYAGLLRLAMMRPDYVKLDRTVVAGVRDSDAQCAVLEALVTFSHRMGAFVIGEGVESLADLAALAEFDVDYGQGWAVGRPGRDFTPIRPMVVTACHRARGRLLQRRVDTRFYATDTRTATTRGMHAITSAMYNATGLTDLHGAAAEAAAELGVDVISVSVLGQDDVLREVTTIGEAINTDGYELRDFPCTANVLRTGQSVEVHVNDSGADAAEVALLRDSGSASLLMMPVSIGERPVGVLELISRRHRRWTTHDIAHARGLATHLGHALNRINA
ncbi:EAL domain-containing protein [uncultured Jatrophihabitans sp.]|uniref:EAL domain-containing protein n=1 Tax=uncultured Jatrophihabitans sp. TaxID=1610747 RepID=UPI0035CA8DCC